MISCEGKDMVFRCALLVAVSIHYCWHAPPSPGPSKFCGHICHQLAMDCTAGSGEIPPLIQEGDLESLHLPDFKVFVDKIMIVCGFH
jgi:hypothetical protein